MYLKIVKDILQNRGEHRRLFKKIFTMARQEFLNTKTPNYLNLFNGSSGYIEESIKSQRSRLRKLNIIDGDGVFTEGFFDEYVESFNRAQTKKTKLDAIKKDSSFFDDVVVEDGYDYVNTMDIIRANPHIIYHLPDLPIKSLDYFDTHGVQIIKMNHVGGNPVVQLPLSFHYRCNKCQFETSLSYDHKKVSCPAKGCDGSMVRVKSQDAIRPAYASRVITDDLNSLSIVSLTEIPQGEFIGAVFLCRNRADYYLFMIATEEIEPTSSTITIDPSRHAIWQIIEQIDRLHEDRIGKHIHGLEWYKAAILLAYLANCKGRVSTNVLIVGDPGVGKTSTPRFYMATLTPQQKVQDAMNLTGPGLHGSMAQIKIGDSTVNVPEAGLLVRHKLVVIDELLENRNVLMPQLKTALASNTISREVHGNRTQIPKYATAIATSNPLPVVAMEQIKWMDMWYRNKNDTSIFSSHPAKDAMVEEWTKRGFEWRTGQPLADIDRYPLIFFVRDPSDDIKDYDLGGEDNAIDDLQLAKILYDPDVNEYFSFYGQLHVDWKEDQDKIIDLVKELRAKDNIHSKKRLSQNVTLMLQLSAQINGRAKLTNEDFTFVKELWSKTCEWIDVSELSYNSQTTSCPGQDWTIERIKNHVHNYMCGAVATSFHMSDRGFSQISAQLEDDGAPSELIKSVVEHYRQNPNQ